MITIIALILGLGVGLFLCKLMCPKVTFERVENKDKKVTSNSFYFLLKTKTDNYLFTEEQLNVAKERANKNPEDIK